MSLPLPSHLYSLTTPTSKKETSKKLSNLMFTRPEQDASGSSTPSQNEKLLEDMSSALSKDDSTIDESKKEEVIPKITTSHSSSSRGSTESSFHDPQSPSFHKPYLDRVPLLQTDDTKTREQKAAELDYVNRRRSQSNPIFPNQPFRPVDKKLLLEPSRKATSRGRSSSEASSIKDDDDMSVVIVNENDDNTESWSIQEVK
jgi:hypothetical protein